MAEEQKQLTPQQQFEQKIIERLRADIGNLLPDNVLSSLVEKAIENMFFIRTERETSYYKKVVEPSWFEKEVEKQLQANIVIAVQAYFKEHAPELIQQASAAIAADAPKLLAAFFISMLQSNANGMGWQLSTWLQQTLQNIGKP